MFAAAPNSGTTAAACATPARPAEQVLRGGRLATVLLAALAASALALAALLANTGMSLSPEFANYTLLGISVLALAAFCHLRGHDWRLKDSASVVGVAIAALMLCGLVSNIGLRLALPLADPMLSQSDSIIGMNVPAAVRFTASQPFVSQALYLAYASSGVLCIAAIAWQLARNDRRALWRTVATLVLAMQITALVSVLFPARGAILTFGLDALQGQGLPFGAGSYSASNFAHFYAGSDPLVTLAKMHGIVTFPSFHTVMALLVVQGFYRSRLRNVAVAWCALTIVSTVPMGGHYVTDLAGGFLVWLGSYLIASWACPADQAAAH